MAPTQVAETEAKANAEMERLLAEKSTTEEERRRIKEAMEAQHEELTAHVRPLLPPPPPPQPLSPFRPAGYPP